MLLLLLRCSSINRKSLNEVIFLTEHILLKAFLCPPWVHYILQTATNIPSNMPMTDLAKRKNYNNVLPGLETQQCQTPTEYGARMCNSLCVNGPSFIIVCFACMTVLWMKMRGKYSHMWKQVFAFKLAINSQSRKSRAEPTSPHSLRPGFIWVDHVHSSHNHRISRWIEQYSLFYCPCVWQPQF